MPVALGLLSSLLWGTSDFLGGTLTRRLPVTTVLLSSQLVALVGLVPLAVGTGGFTQRPDYLPSAVAAGLIGMVALGAFFRALAQGTMGVVAPIAALGVGVPVGLGLAAGESPSGPQLVGMAIAVGGVVAACGPELSGPARAAGGARVLALALVAALGFGLVIELVAQGSRGPGTDLATVVMVLFTMRAASASVLLVRLAVRRERLFPAGSGRPWTALAAVGLCDVGANGSFAVASRGGLVSVVAVLASLYPVMTLLLARRVHGERLARTQLAGVGVSLCGVVLLSAG